MSGAGPLAGLRVVEFEGLAPLPFAAMMFADLGASVVRIERVGKRPPTVGDPRLDVLLRGREGMPIDLKRPEGRAEALRLLADADILLEAHRPGVMERLRLGPADCAPISPRLIYVRITGWGQEGPAALAAGHDINYLALAGALYPMGPADAPPMPPLNLIGDFGGGGMLAVVGALAALTERARTGRGQVVDAAMIDGVGLHLAQLFGWRAMGVWDDHRGTNLLDGGAYFYRCYACADGAFIAVGALEPEFHARFITGLGLDPADFHPQYDRSRWPERAEQIAAVFAERSRDAWAEAFAGSDACVTPVLTPGEAVLHPANQARHAHLDVSGQWQPAPAPRFRTP